MDNRNVGMTPLMRQYLSLKGSHQDCLLFFRLGDFYELFFEDAVLVSKLLQLTLTSRDRSENPIPMCGVPYHAAKGYLAKLIDAGHKVAICEQMEEPGPGKGLVRREVTQIIAPGTVMDEENLNPAAANYLALIHRSSESWQLAHVDVSIGEAYVSEWPDEELLTDVLMRIAPRHLLISAHLAGEPLFGRLRELLPSCFMEQWQSEGDSSAQLLAYLRAHEPQLLKTITTFAPFSEASLLPIDASTQMHLEFFKSGDGKGSGSLYHHMNQTGTPMGARLLRKWLSYPSTDLAEIEARQAAAGALLAEGTAREVLRSQVGEAYDIERLLGKVQVGRASPRDLHALKLSLQAVEKTPSLFNAGLHVERLCRIKGRLAISPEIAHKIDCSLVPNPPYHGRDGAMIRDGISPELDRLRAIFRDGKGYLAELERAEREKTGIPSLKVRYNKVFGYYIEVTNVHRHKVPERYLRKQTTANAERYITEDLKRAENEILSAERKAITLEQALFDELCLQLAEAAGEIRIVSAALAELDVLLAFASLAEKYHYTRPIMHDGFDALITDGRHPTLETHLPKGQFVANDLAFREGESLLLITGPNMAGKSTVMRQTALIYVMAQMGAYVPAREARLGIVDRIFTRIGASDNLLEGKSTFMVEMTEAARILKQATPRSFIILDEIGRGTSTFDGVSLARSVAEYLIERLGAKTLFATHYHELAELETHYPSVKNYTMLIKEWQGKLVFLYRFLPGASNRSYGVEVARLAGLPESVIDRAKQILEALEVGESVSEEKLDAGKKISCAQLDLFSSAEKDALHELRSVDPNRLTPLEALTLLSKLRNQLFGE